MMKVLPQTSWHRYAFNVLVLLLFCAFSAQANPITWIGGSGDWEDPNNWDLGREPNYKDHVIIENGTVEIQGGHEAYATSVEVANSSRFIQNGTLVIIGAKDIPGLEVRGLMIVNEYLHIEGIFGATSNGFNGTGIYVSGTMTVEGDGEVALSNIARNGITVDGSGRFTNNGSIDISDINWKGIDNDSRFINNGAINMNLSTAYDIGGIVNTDRFTNGANGDIYISGGYNQAIHNKNRYSRFTNDGLIISENVARRGVRNEGWLNNQSEGLMQINVTGFIGIYNTTSGVVENNGTIHSVNNLQKGFLNDGTVRNYGNLTLSGRSYSLRNYVNGSISNFSTLLLRGNYNTDLHNYGEIFNTEEGYIYIRKKAYLRSNSSIANDGFVVSSYDGFHSVHNNAEVINNGSVNDYYNSFHGTIDNNQVIIKELTSPLQNGVPFQNPIEVQNLNNVTIQGFYLDRTVQNSAGVYNSTTNTFTPNASAIGADVLYISVGNNTSGNSQSTRLYLSQPVQAYTTNSNLTSESTDELELRLQPNATDLDFQVYPNPTSGSFTLDGFDSAAEAKEVFVFNNLGALVYQQSLIGSKNWMDLPKDLANGVYHIQVRTHGKIVGNKRLVLEKL